MRKGTIHRLANPNACCKLMAFRNHLKGIRLLGLTLILPIKKCIVQTRRKVFRILSQLVSFSNIPTPRKTETFSQSINSPILLHFETEQANTCRNV